MNTTFKSSSEKQIEKIRLFAKKNNIYFITSEQEEVYSITLSGLTLKEIEKFLKGLKKALNLKPVSKRPLACAA
jgi:hypothetical protein